MACGICGTTKHHQWEEETDNHSECPICASDLCPKHLDLLYDFLQKKYNVGNKYEALMYLRDIDEYNEETDYCFFSEQFEQYLLKQGE